jgi:hypothetical protein
VAKNPNANQPKCPGCGHAVNAKGNCFTDGCWNSNSQRHSEPRRPR